MTFSVVCLLFISTAGDLLNIPVPEGNCSIRFPGKPRVSPSPTGASYLLEDGQGTSYQFIIHKNAQGKGLSREAQERVIDSGRDAILKRLDARIVSEKKTPLDGYPGREILSEGKSKKGTIRHRLIIVEDRIFQFLVVGPAKTVNSRQTTEILQSLKLDSK